MKKLILYVLIIASALSLAEAQIPFQRPESVVWDGARNRYLVSCVESKNIVVVDPNGVPTSELKTGLQGPKGMILIDTVLYFTDVNRILGINVNTGETVLTNDIPNSQFLNDITTDGAGNLYFTDSQTNDIRKLEIAVNGQTGLLTTFNTGPNGIYYDAPNNRLVVVYLSDSPQTIQSINLADNTVSDLSTMGFTRADGLAFHNNVWYVSSWTTGRIYSLNQDMTAILDSTEQTFNGPADFIYNAQTNQFVLPVMMEHRIAFLNAITGVNDNKSEGFNVAPNPVGDKLRFQIGEEFVGGNYSVVSLGGKIALNGEVKSVEQEISIRELAPGSYFLKMGNGSLSKSMQFIKE